MYVCQLPRLNIHVVFFYFKKLVDLKESDMVFSPLESVLSYPTHQWTTR